ncbi:hypothetical protein QIG43_27745, partial [Klebsiella pneumoniae]|nr:hypothetical protein [Klebsiella pneumoniae]
IKAIHPLLMDKRDTTNQRQGYGIHNWKIRETKAFALHNFLAPNRWSPRAPLRYSLRTSAFLKNKKRPFGFHLENFSE